MGATTFPASAIVSGVIAPVRLGTGSPSAANFLRGDGSWQVIDLSAKLDVSATTAFSRSLLDDADAATARTTLGLGPNQNVSFASVQAIINGGAGDQTRIESNRIVVGGSARIAFTSGSWSQPEDVVVRRGGPGILEQRNGLIPQAFRIYNTHTSSTTWEALEVDWQTVPDTCVIGTNRGSLGGAKRILQIGGPGTNFVSIFSVLEVYGSFIRFKGSVTPDGTAIGTADIGATNRPFRNIFLRPSPSLTPLANGDFCIEATNDNTLTFKLRGSDGTVRSGLVALS